ncbi:Uncharacterized protein APZ42_006900, partial [Daphnia magna]
FFFVCFALVGGCCGSSSVLCVWFVIYACLCVCVCVVSVGSRCEPTCVLSQNCQPSCSQVRSLFRTCHAVVKCFVSENMILTRASGDHLFFFCLLYFGNYLFFSFLATRLGLLALTFFVGFFETFR